MSSQRKIVVDTDPGTDDAVALLWLAQLARAGEIELCAVTTCAGNSTASTTHGLAGRVLTLAGLDLASIPLGRGEDSSQKDDGFHGEDGMGGLASQLPPWTPPPQPPSSRQVLADQLRRGGRTVLCLAPLTNLAAVERDEPGILARAHEIVCMVGAFDHPGNVTPSAEFNAWWDPEALDVVLRSGARVVIMPLDVTTRLTLGVDDLRGHGVRGKIGKFLEALCSAQAAQSQRYRETAQARMLLHDVSTVLYLLFPHMFIFRKARVWVEASRASPNRGQTGWERRCAVTLAANAWVATGVERVELLALSLCQGMADL